jgi:hypothetical protein
LVHFRHLEVQDDDDTHGLRGGVTDFPAAGTSFST